MRSSVSSSTAAEPFPYRGGAGGGGNCCVDEAVLPRATRAITSKRQGGDDLCVTDGALQAGRAPHIWGSFAVSPLEQKPHRCRKIASSSPKMDARCHLRWSDAASQSKRVQFCDF